jgi:hypothetical protein
MATCVYNSCTLRLVHVHSLGCTVIFFDGLTIILDRLWFSCRRVDQPVVTLHQAYIQYVPIVCNSAGIFKLTFMLDDDPAITTSIYGCMMLFRGVGNILSTPISTVLISNIDPSTPGFLTDSDGLVPGSAYKSSYRNVILYAGTSFASAAMVVAMGWIIDTRSARRLRGSGEQISTSRGE